jgi:alpha-glucosidase
MNYKIKSTIDFAVNDQFVTPLYPSIGDVVTINLYEYFEDGKTAEYIALLALQQGEYKHIPLYRIPEKDGTNHHRLFFHVWEVALTIAEPKLIFTILAKYTTDNNPPQYIYTTEDGNYHRPPPSGSSFIILANLKIPHWVSSSVFYQIFPDRFYNGNPDVGVRTGEYHFDGVSSVECSWDSPPQEFSEAHCVDFYNGDLPGIEQKLDYLQNLGVNALYLNPVFSARTHHRYDAIDFENVEEHLGGNNALASLSTAMKKRGMKLILDISINHTGSEHSWFKQALGGDEFVDYYYIEEDGTYEGWEGIKTLPQLNYSSQSLRDFIWNSPDAILKRFLKPPYEIDGWRFDVAAMTGKHNEDDYTDEIWREVRKAVKEINNEVMIFGEYWDDARHFLQGNMWDSVMNYAVSNRLLRAWLGEEDRYAKGTWPFPLTQGCKLSGLDLAAGIEEYYKAIPPQLRNLQFNVFDTHDTPRFHTHTELFNFKTYAGVIMLQFCLPGTPVIYYGDENGQAGHPKSMEGARYPFNWDESVWNRDFRLLYKALAKLKRESKILSTGMFEILNAEKNIVVYIRYLKSAAILGILNRSMEKETITVDLKRYPFTAGSDLFTEKKVKCDSNGIVTLEIDPQQSYLFF